MTKSNIYKIILFISLIVVYILSVIPGEMLIVKGFWDKTNHFLAFAWLGLWSMLSYAIAYRLVFVYLLGFGIFIEISQTFSVNRYAEFADVVADGLGIIIGLVLVVGWRYLSLSQSKQQ